jgi:hypothetical protein
LIRKNGIGQELIFLAPLLYRLGYTTRSQSGRKISDAKVTYRHAVRKSTPCETAKVSIFGTSPISGKKLSDKFLSGKTDKMSSK